MAHPLTRSAIIGIDVNYRRYFCLVTILVSTPILGIPSIMVGQFLSLGGVNNLHGNAVPQSITQSTDMATISVGSSSACEAGPGIIGANSFLRRFDLDGEFGLSHFSVSSVEWAIESAVAGPTYSDQPSIVFLYQIANSDELNFTNMGDPIGARNYEIPDLTLAAINTPVTSPVINALTHDLVVEIYKPSGEFEGHRFAIGSNGEGETSDSYIFAPQCFTDNNVPVRLSSVFPGMNLIMRVNGDDLLPVELNNFSAIVDGETVFLNWTTLSESNNSGFEVERIVQGRAENLGFVAGIGTTMERQEYTYKVEGLLPGVHEFRLKQIDWDGSIEYSSELVVEVTFPSHYFLSDVYPNPFSTKASLKFGMAETQVIEVTLFNSLGHVVQRLYKGEVKGGAINQLKVDGERLTNGVYFLKVSGKNIDASKTLNVIK